MRMPVEKILKRPGMARFVIPLSLALALVLLVLLIVSMNA